MHTKSCPCPPPDEEREWKALKASLANTRSINEEGSRLLKEWEQNRSNEQKHMLAMREADDAVNDLASQARTLQTVLQELHREGRKTA